MYKKLAIVLSILIIAIFSFSACFANDMVNNAVNGVRNVVGGAENAVEDAAKDVTNATKDATNSVESKMENATNKMNTNVEHNTTRNTTNDRVTSNTSTYNATRTNAEGSTLMGMNATMWTWLIIGIATIAIVALVWYYSMQMRSSNYDDKD